MRYAIFSDVHANLRAWERVLDDIRGQHADVLVCLGDVVGYGPKPEEVLQQVRMVTENFVMGNHDAAAAGAMDYSAFNDHAKHSIEWTAESLTPESREFLGSVPLGIENGDILFVHAEISDPGCFGYIDDLESAGSNFASAEHFITFVGHTHTPNIFRLDENGHVSELPDHDQQLDPSSRYIVNVGSVGEPRNPDDLRGVYVIYDSETLEVTYRRINFDIEAYRFDLESTTLGLKPFFLQCYEHQVSESETTLLEAARALAMEAPAAVNAVTSFQSGSVKLHIPSHPERIWDPIEGEGAVKKKGNAALLTTLVLCGLLLIACGIWATFHFRGDSYIDEIVLQEENRTILPDKDVIPGSEGAGDNGQDASLNPEEDPPVENPPDPVGIKDTPIASRPIKDPPAVPDTDKPKEETKPDPLVAWWRMDSDSLSDNLLDQVGNHSLPVELAGSRIRALAPEILPGNGFKNEEALELGVWSETEPGGVFGFRKDRSFTIEGWLLAGQPTVPIFLAGTRSGEGNADQGWHLDIRPPSESFPDGQISFFFDNGPEIFQALSENVSVANLTPHHFAAVWDHQFSKASGEMRLFIDGELVASAEVPHAQVPASQANPFRIGSPSNPPRVGLDELRFHHAALYPRQFLNITPEIVLLEEGFEKPDVEGFQTKSAPPGWVGSTAGFGSNRRGLIDQGGGNSFTTNQGRQAFILNYANTGLTSGKSAISEPLAAGMIYQVSFSVGAKKGETSEYLVEFVAFEPGHGDNKRVDTTSKSRPGVVLAQAKGTVKSNDLSHTDSIVFTAKSANPHIGKALGVRLARLGHAGNPIFDDIRVTSRTEVPILARRNSTSVTTTPAIKPTPKDPPGKTAGKASGANPPRPKADPTVAWWRMDSNSLGNELVDSLGNRSLPVGSPGKQIAVLAPETIPSNGKPNEAALSLGVWGASKPLADFCISSSRSFTLEGWFLTARPRGPIFLAGTRSGDSNDKQGWHVDIRPGNLMCFFYDNGPENIQALSEELALGNLTPHHFAAVWDHDVAPSAGEMRLYLDGELVAENELPHSQIPSKPANAFQVGALTNPPKVGLDEMRFSHAALSPLEFLRVETQSMTANGKWGEKKNWSAGEPPTGTQTAVVDKGVVVYVEAAPPKFLGDLVLKRSAKMSIHTPEAFAIIPDSPSKLVLHKGASLFLLVGKGSKASELKRIELVGDATIWGGRSNSGHHATRVFSQEISGKGALILDGVNNNQFSLAVANSFEGGFIAKSSQKQGFRVRALAPGSLGTGDVEIAANASLYLDAPSAMSPDATLKLVGPKDGRVPSKVILGEANVVASLVIDGKPQKAGTWGTPGSGADNEHAHFSGTGILTVRR